MRKRTWIALALLAVSAPAVAQIKLRTPDEPPAIAASALGRLKKPSALGVGDKLARYAGQLKVVAPPASALEQPFRVTPRAPVAGSAKTYFMYASVFPFAIPAQSLPDGAAQLDAKSSPKGEILVTFEAAPARTYLVDCETSEVPVKVTLSTGASFTLPATGGHLVFGIPPRATGGMVNFLLEATAQSLDYYSCEITPVK